jgi:hypothetical protein
MNLSEFRDRFEKYWTALDRDAVSRKDSHGVVFDLFEFYSQLDSDERALADQVLVEWIDADDARKRFDALALVDRFRVSAAVPKLRELDARLQQRTDPEAPYELAKVRRILRHVEPDA